MGSRKPRLDSSRIIPLFPDEPQSAAPAAPPNLDSVELLAVDCESYDPLLEVNGPGFLRGDARLAGVALATADASWYFPLTHIRGNCAWDARSWLQDVLRESRRYVFCNAHYDVEALWTIDAVPAGRWSDISINQALINEEFKPGYGLDAISTFWTGEGKDERELLEAAASLGCKTSAEAKKVIAYLDGGSVCRYASVDAERTIQSYLKQVPQIETMALEKVLELEENLLGLTWQMRLNGVAFDISAAERMRDEYMVHEHKLLRRLWSHAGFAMNVWSPRSLQRYCHSRDLLYRKTGAGNASFENIWLEGHTDAGLQLVAEIRKYEKMRRDFIESWLAHQINGRIHPRWMQTMTEDGGTRSGRMASADPNLQQVPVRDPTHGPRLRSLFVANKKWGKFDYQAQEIRVAIHFAAVLGCMGVENIVEKYCKDHTFDFHGFVAKMAGIERTPAKTLALGSLYGMQPKKTMASLGLPEDEAFRVYRDYFLAAPYFKELSEIASRRAEERGYVRTFLGRRRRFKEGANFHKALNAIVQGTSADMIKQAMWDVYQKFDIVPLVAVHDETGYDIEDSQASPIADIMENAFELKVPMLVEPTLSRNWNTGEFVEKVRRPRQGGQDRYRKHRQ